MMKYYQELTFFARLEIPLPALWSKVYETVHIALAEDSGGEIDISFPAYGDVAFPLGINEDYRSLGGNFGTGCS